MRKYWLLLLLLLLALLPPILGLRRYDMQVLDIALINVLLALALTAVFGMAGQLSLGHAGLFAIGAYASAILTVTHKQPFLIGVGAAVVAGAVAGVLIGAPALRLSGHYLALATLGFGQIVQLVILNLPTITHGHDGIAGVPAPKLFGWEARTLGQQYYLLLGAVVLVLILLNNLQRSRLGRALAAIREDELAAKVAGVDVAFHKVFAFALSAALAGLAGALYAHMFTFISPDVFNASVSINIVAMVVIGGSSTLTGSVVGAVLLTMLPEWLRFSKTFYMVLYGVGIVAITVFLPEGVVGAAKVLLQRFRRPERPERGVPHASSTRT